MKVSYVMMYAITVLAAVVLFLVLISVGIAIVTVTVSKGIGFSVVLTTLVFFMAMLCFGMCGCCRRRAYVTLDETRDVRKTIRRLKKEE